MMFAKIYSVAVALIYFGLAIWCTVSPEVTSEKVGFELKGGYGSIGIHDGVRRA